MKVLQICSKPPLPVVDGGTRAMHQLSELLLQEGAELKLLCISTPKHPFNATIDSMMEQTKMEHVFIDTSLKISKALINLFTLKSYHIERFESEVLRRRILEILRKEKIDIVILDSLFSAVYWNEIRNNSKARIFLRAHNVEYLIWEERAKTTSNPFKKWYFNLLSKRLKRFELFVANNADGVLCISEKDLNTFKSDSCKSKLYTISFAADFLADEAAILNKEKPSAYHLAAMDWQPNLEAVLWFVNEVWPLLKRKNNEIAIHLAGRQMPPSLVEKSEEQLHIQSDISDLKTFLNQHSMLIVPLLTGSGVRIKIIEALGLGKVVISTSKGIEGLALEHEKNVLIADNAEEFANAIAICAKNESLHNKIAENALKFARENLSKKPIGKTLIEAIQTERN